MLNSWKSVRQDTAQAVEDMPEPELDYGQQVTNLEMLETIKDHEFTHRSQLFMYLRLKGIVPVTTRRRQAAR